MKTGILSLLAWSLPFLLMAQNNASTQSILEGNENGIQWVTGLTWEQVKEKAKKENKSIFLDCFATWCAPCHEMDKNVYPDKKVGEAINEKFIAVKVQMDKTSYDNDTIKKWYMDANTIQKNYVVNSFPTFLFFSPQGQPLHRAAGYRSPTEFLALAEDALNPEKQYYALLKNYQPGKIDTSELKGLARALRNSGGELPAKMALEYLSRIPPSELSNEDNIILMCQFGNNKAMQQFAGKYLLNIPAKKYSEKMNWTLIRTFSQERSIHDRVLQYLRGLKMGELRKQLSVLTVFKTDSGARAIANKYINSLKNDELFTKDNLLFVQQFTNSSKDIGFMIFRENPARIDKVMGSKNYANIIVENVIIDEYYDSCFQTAIKNKADNMPWDSIAKQVKTKYGNATAERVDLQVRSSLYRYLAEKTNKYWPEYIKFYIDKIEKNGYDTTHPQIQFLDVVNLNNFVFNAIFYHSNDTGQMKTGLRWMEGVLRRNPKEANNIDTYANLLYKLGRGKEAVEWQQKAIQIAIEEKDMNQFLPSLEDNLSKMKRGIPTWILPDKIEEQ
jgi:thioredoxin-related protein